MKISIALKKAKSRQASIADGDALAKALEVVIKKHFPKSLVRVICEKNALDPKKNSQVWITFAVAGSKEEVSMGYFENDISFTKIVIYGMDSEKNFTGPLKFDPRQGGSIWATPWIKVGLRKKTGTPEQIVKHTDQYFAKLLAMLKANADKIDENKKSLLKSIKL